jgi:hypothetical protein
MVTATDAPYRELARTYARHPLGAPQSDTFIEILKFYFEPDEAALAASMEFEPEPEEVIAARAGVATDEASELLTRMSSKLFILGFRRPDGTRTFRLKIIAAGAGCSRSRSSFGMRRRTWSVLATSGTDTCSRAWARSSTAATSPSRARCRRSRRPRKT